MNLLSELPTTVGYLSYAPLHLLLLLFLVEPVRSSRNGLKRRETSRMEVSSGWLDAAEREERGFLAGEELAMPLPVLSSSSDDEHGLFARHPPPSSQKTLPAPSEEYTRQLLYGASAHSHASRGLKGMSFFQQLRREDEGEGMIPPSNRLFRLQASELSIQRFEQLQAAPLVIEGMGSAEGWPIASSCADEASFLSAMGDSLQLPITELLPTHGMGKPQKLRLRLREYRAYAEENEVDFPYYPWERDFDREVRRTGRFALRPVLSPHLTSNGISPHLLRDSTSPLVQSPHRLCTPSRPPPSVFHISSSRLHSAPTCCESFGPPRRSLSPEICME